MPSWPEASEPISGGDHAVAEVALEALDVVARRAVRPHVAVHRRGERRPARHVARQVAVTTSFAIPFAIAPSQRAVAGATTITSAASATTMCPIRWSGSSPRTSVSTAWRESAPNVSGPTNVAAAGVSITTTSAPSTRSRRSSSTAL